MDAYNNSIEQKVSRKGNTRSTPPSETHGLPHDKPEEVSHVSAADQETKSESTGIKRSARPTHYHPWPQAMQDQESNSKP